MFLHESVVPSSGEHFEVDISVLYIIATGLTLLLGSRKYVCVCRWIHTRIYFLEPRSNVRPVAIIYKTEMSTSKCSPLDGTTDS